MRCSDSTEWIARKLDGTLSENRLRELDEHLAGCSLCRAELRLQERIHSALARPVPSGLSPDFTLRVRERAQGMKQARPWRFRWPVVVSSGLVALGFVATFLLKAALVHVFLAAFGPASGAVADSFRSVGGITLDPGMEFLRSLPGELHRVGSSSGVTPGLLAVTLLALASMLWATRKMLVFLRD